MKAIGLDIGTTSICGILADCETGAAERAVNRPNDTWIAAPHPWEKLQDPKRIQARVYEILKELDGPDIGAIGVTGQMHGIVYLNAQGQPVSPLYIWQDGRGDQPYGEGTYASHLGSHTGYGNVTHFYNQVNGLVPETAAVFCTIHDYIAMDLAGRTAPLVHSSDGASFGLYDMEGNRFLRPDPMQPQLTTETAALGRWRGIPVAAAIGDNQASFLGGGCGGDTVLVNVGTGSQVSFMADPGQTAAAGLELRPLYDGRRLLVGSSLCGGRAYALLERFFREAAALAGDAPESLYDAMGRAAQATPDTQVTFETLFCGTREEPWRRASIQGLSEDNFTPGHLIRACLRGMSAELWELYRNGGGHCTRLVGTGNGIRKNKALAETVAEQFGMTPQVPLFQEEAAMGAALFAMTAAGMYQNIEEAERIVNYETV